MTGQINGKKRQNKGQFKKGSPGGPGRPKKQAGIDNNDLLDLWQKTDNKIKKLLNSDNEKTVLTAIRDSIKSQELRIKYEAKSATGDTLIDASVQAALGSAIDRILAGDETEFDDDQDFLDD